MKDPVKWWQVFEDLSQILISIYEDRHHTNDANRHLFKKLNGNAEFRKENTWIEKFKTKFEIEGLDPIHVFASFNGNKMSQATRVRRVRLLLKILGKPMPNQNIDFEGCPTPMIIYLIGARGHNDQRDIWEVFYDVKKRSGTETLSSNFDLFNLWYGVAFGSFTIFLFWINSDFYLSMDKNNRTFLIVSGILKRKISDFSMYLDFNKKIRKLNKTFTGDWQVEKYGKSGLFIILNLISIAFRTE
jgi:hypothetical protein